MHVNWSMTLSFECHQSGSPERVVLLLSQSLHAILLSPFLSLSLQYRPRTFVLDVLPFLLFQFSPWFGFLPYSCVALFPLGCRGINELPGSCLAIVLEPNKRLAQSFQFSRIEPETAPIEHAGRIGLRLLPSGLTPFGAHSHTHHKRVAGRTRNCTQYLMHICGTPLESYSPDTIARGPDAVMMHLFFPFELQEEGFGSVLVHGFGARILPIQTRVTACGFLRRQRVSVR